MFNQDLLSLLRVSAGSEKMLRRNSVVELWMIGGGRLDLEEWRVKICS